MMPLSPEIKNLIDMNSEFAVVLIEITNNAIMNRRRLDLPPYVNIIRVLRKYKYLPVDIEKVIEKQQQERLGDRILSSQYTMSRKNK